jgi:hypothetical protein
LQRPYSRLMIYTSVSWTKIACSKELFCWCYKLPCFVMPQTMTYIKKIYKPPVTASDTSPTSPVTLPVFDCQNQVD